VKCVQNIGRKPEWKISLGVPGCRCEDNIRMDLKVVVWGGLECMYLAQGRD